MKSDLKDQLPNQWILVRGLAREADHWGAFRDQLAQFYPKSRIMCLDLPGSGEHHRLESPTTIGGMVEFMHAQFVKQADLLLPGARFVFAVSLGAMVGVEWLRRYPEDFHGAVFCNTSLRSRSPFYKRLWMESYWHLARAIKEKDPIERERHILAMVSNRVDVREKTALQWAEIQRRRPITMKNALRQLLAAATYQPPLTRPLSPVLLLNSLRDRMVHPSCSKVIADQWHCELKRHPTAGHDLPLDAPQWVIEQIDEWLANFDYSVVNLRGG